MLFVFGPDQSCRVLSCWQRLVSKSANSLILLRKPYQTGLIPRDWSCPWPVPNYYLRHY